MDSHIITSFRDLLLYRDKWRDSLSNHIGPLHPFLDFIWVQNHCSYFMPEKELYINVFSNGDGTSIFPLYRKQGIYNKIGFIKKGLTDYGDAIISRNHFSCLHNIFYTSKADWVDFPHVREDSPLISLIKDFSSNKDGKEFTIMFEESTRAPYIILENQQWDFYVSSLKSKFKANLMRRIKNLSTIGKIEFGWCKDNDELKDVTRIMRLQHIRRREYLGQDKSIFLNKIVRNFFDEVNSKLFGDKLLWLFYLKCNEKIIATVQCFLYGNRLYHYIPSFDVEYNQYSPGRILNYNIIQFAFERGFGEIDFMIGDEDYKLEWNTQIRKTYAISLFRKNLSGRIAFLARKIVTAKEKIKNRLIKSKFRDIKRNIFRKIYTLTGQCHNVD